MFENGFESIILLLRSALRGRCFSPGLSLAEYFASLTVEPFVPDERCKHTHTHTRDFFKHGSSLTAV